MDGHDGYVGLTILVLEEHVNGRNVKLKAPPRIKSGRYCSILQSSVSLIDVQGLGIAAVDERPEILEGGVRG